MRSASTARNSCPGTIVRSVQPAPGTTLPSGPGRGLERADRGRPDRHDAAAPLAGAVDRRGRRHRDLVALRLHAVLGQPLGADGPERAGPDVKRHPVDRDAPGAQVREELLGEVEARPWGRRRRRAGSRRRSDTAPSPRRRASGTGGCRAAAGAAHGPRERPARPPSRPAGLRPGPVSSRAVTVARAAPSARVITRPDRTAAGRPEERRPVLRRRADRVKEQDLDVRRRPRDPPEQPGGQDARVVHDEAVPSPEEPAEVRHPGVPECPRPPIEDQEARRIAVLRGLLGDPIRRQREIVQGELAGDLGDASQCGFPARRPGRDGAGRPFGRPRRRRGRAPRT